MVRMAEATAVLRFLVLGILLLLGVGLDYLPTFTKSVAGESRKNFRPF